MDLLESFSKIEFESPTDKIIRQIKNLISSGQLKPGDKLPAERKMCEKLGVGRTNLRDAIKKLEFYGILKTYRQSGTVVAGLGLPALEGLISDMLSLEDTDFKSLVHTRVILEKNAAMLAAENRTEGDLAEMEKALQAHKDKLEQDNFADGEDLLFHLKIAEGSKNSVLKSLMLIITPEILAYFKRYNVGSNARAKGIVQEHELLLQCIRDKDPVGAGRVLTEHLNDIVTFANNHDEPSDKRAV